MRLALRPYVTTGVALVGAAVIVASPVAPPPPDIQVAAPAVTTAKVQLAADFVTLFVDTATNLGLLFDQASFEYVVQGTNPPETDTTFTPNFDQRSAKTGKTLFKAFSPRSPAASPCPPDVVDAVLEAITIPIDNFLAVADIVLDPEFIRFAANVLVGPLFSTVFATGEAIENVLDPNTPEDFVPALINFVPTVLDGLLNGGYGEIPDRTCDIPPGIPPGSTVRPGGLLNQAEAAGTPPSDFTLPGVASGLLGLRDQIALTLGITRAPEAARPDSSHG